jgi:hypothetical protein
MAKENGVAEIGLPGEVLLPNAADKSLFSAGQGFDDHLGTELENPGTQNAEPLGLAPFPPIPTPKQPPTDDKRYEHWQSVADREKQRADLAEQKLLEKAKMDPLINMLQQDKEAYQYLEQRLSGNRTPDKPLEPPQIPAGYNEVEAFSNPESVSFKYRQAKDAFVEQRFVQLEKKNQELVQAREQERTLLQQQRANQEQMVRYKQTIVNLGIPEEQFNDFFDWQNKATPEELVQLYKYSKSRTIHSTGTPRFDGPLTASAGGVEPKPLSAGDAFVALSRKF